MNPKQIACLVLMIFIGLVTYCGQIVHKKVTAMKEEATAASDAATAAEQSLQTAEILTTKTKAETEELRRFLSSWTPYADKIQTEQEIESAFDFSLRDRSITLVRSRKSELKANRADKSIPKVVLTTLVVEDEYAKVLNWFGDIEKRLPLARVTSCNITGGSTVRQLRLEVSIETPIIDVGADLTSAADKEKKKKT
jgi:hypothetical protein